MRWIERPIENPTVVQTLSEALNSLPEPLARFLILRGIDSVDVARSYFRGTKKELHDPHLLAEVDQAARRIACAITEKENVLVYGDFDADGITSTALLLQFLGSHGLATESYIPHRQKENHGFHKAAIDLAQSRQCSLIITVDCGTNDEETALRVKEAGIDLIICDHHQNEDKYPLCAAHVNPNRKSCPYPHKEISACALAYKMIQVTLESLDKPAEIADQYLWLVAISTVCDIMPLTGENRILVREGLNVLHMSEHAGIQALISASKCSQKHLTSTDIGMQLGPRLNAAGRLTHADEALSLLMAEDEAEARKLVKRLDKLNQSRKALGAKLRMSANKIARTQLAGTYKSALVLYDSNWHPGILGPAASQMIREFSLPTVILTDAPGSNGKEIVGSARTWGEVNIFDALTECQDLLIRFGGHEKAAGMTLKKEDLLLFKERLNTAVNRQLGEKIAGPVLEYDARLTMEEIPGKFERILKLCQPFGKENEVPLFLMENLRPVYVKVLSGGLHLKMNVQDSNSSIVMDAIGFGLGQYEKIAEEARVLKTGLDFLCHVEENRWNGRVTTQLRIEALRAHIRS
ncbi:MAG: single-stranded-DNA-specific exonuclease RecJ [Bacteroidetes bacterium]|nr:single-stranded-DNA-specific exonuclease RecJ [Bacteroidota bacterium]MCY4204365.1 single-stranded-DNA-specific exonuclease RecJ [Bacteroidota bacterium]MCY4281299.1 single-stranded-DNA-specific exonuclease RecJ [Acidimicrobiaceae bacterium]